MQTKKQAWENVPNNEEKKVLLKQAWEPYQAMLALLTITPY